MSSFPGLALVLLLQGSPSKPPADALAYLARIVQRYADAKSYYIKATIEQTSNNALSRSWQKSILTAIVAPGGRYRYEGQTGMGSAVAVSNGADQWDYHPEAHEYAKQSVSAGLVGAVTQPISYSEMGVVNAKSLVAGIRNLADPLKSAGFLPDQTIMVDGRAIDCRVVHASDADFKRHSPGMTSDETIWIGKAQKVIVKIFRHGDSYIMGYPPTTHIPIKSTETLVYSVVRLNAPEPEGSFTFTPPPKAKLVASLPGNSFTALLNHAPDFLGKPAPDVPLKREGKEVALSSYRGKPVFIDFWESTCGPCVEAMPELKKLYAETHDKGMVWIGIDRDDSSAAMEAFLKQDPLPWPNYRDGDGSLSKAFQCDALPLGILVDSSGKVVFYNIGYSVAMVRASIARLGPEYSSLAAGPARTAAGPAKP